MHQPRASPAVCLTTVTTVLLRRAQQDEERTTELNTYIGALVGSSYVHELGTDDERNVAHATELQRLGDSHLETIDTLGEVRDKVNEMGAVAWKMLKNPSDGNARSAEGQRPEKMTEKMPALELIEELQMRLAGDDLSWDSFKGLLVHYGIIKLKFTNYINKNSKDAAWKAKPQTAGGAGP